MKTSAGILLYRQGSKGVELLLAHSGGPFFAKKDQGAWTIPKGELQPGEDAVAAAKREFTEETGFAVPDGDLLDLGEIKTSSKIVHIWAIAGDADVTKLKSNTFELEWPSKSGQIQTFPECDRAGWFTPATAQKKLFSSQAPLVGRLLQQLGIADIDEAAQAAQTSLF